MLNFMVLTISNNVHLICSYYSAGCNILSRTQIISMEAGMRDEIVILNNYGAVYNGIT